MIKKVIAYLSYKIRGRKIQFDISITDSDLVSVSLRHSMDLLRGIIRTRKFIFVASNVKLISKRNIHTDKGVSIGRYSTLDGLGRKGIFIGSASSIGSFSLLKVSGSLSHLGDSINIGNNVGIGDFSHIGGAGGVIIGSDTIIGAYFSAHPENHVFEEITKPIRLQGVTHQGIKVGNGCWLGAKVTLLDGAVIGDGCVVAAGAVVRGKFPNNSVLAGVPARIIKMRT